MTKGFTHYPIITISNFKKFVKKISFELKPITILVGPNGSGKSTVIEALNIFSKSLRFFEGSENSPDFLNNYSFEDLISIKNKKRFEISARSQFGSVEEITEEINATTSFINFEGNPTFEILKFEKRMISSSTGIKDRKKFWLKINLNYFKEFKLAVEFKKIVDYLKTELPPSFIEEISDKKEELEKIVSFGLIIYKTDCNYLEEVSKEEKTIIKLSYGILTNKFFYNDYVKDKNMLTILVYLASKRTKYGSNMSFYEISRLSEKAFENFNSIRSNLADVHTNLGTRDLIDETRKQPPMHFIMTDKFIEEDFYELAAFLLGKKNVIDILPGFENRKEILEHWLSEFGIAEEISIKQVEKIKPNTKIFEILLSHKGKSFSLSSLSSGGKQILPIVFNCINYDLARYVRQPELHLHPKLQMKLADFFVYIKNKVEPWFLIIETHSEHLIRKFQLLVAKGEISPKEIHVLYFDINEKDNSTKIVELPLNDRGVFTKPWPHGFFEESATLNIQLIEEILSRKN